MTGDRSLRNDRMDQVATSGIASTEKRCDNRNNYRFAGSDQGGERAAIAHTVIGTVISRKRRRSGVRKAIYCRIEDTIDSVFEEG